MSGRLSLSVKGPLAKAKVALKHHSDAYPAHLKTFYGINAGLKREGISAPQETSLENTRKLYNIIGRPLDNIPTLHIGGTNGKGTTSFKLSETLKANGIRTGLFVSPHLASFRERIQVNSELLPEESFVSNLQTVIQHCKDNSIFVTEFEVTFLMAALHFQQSECEAVVLEVGLGGEYDATNVVSTALGVICSVSLDHTRILGSTVEAIATVKAGIFKEGVPALVGPGVPLAAIQAVAQKRNAILYTYDQAYQEFQPKHWNDSIEFSCNDNTAGISFSPLVDTDALNTNIALLGLHILMKHHAEKFSRVALRLPAHGDADGAGGAGEAGGGGAPLLVDLTSQATREAVQSRPPCRWEKRLLPVERLLASTNANTINAAPVATTGSASASASSGSTCSPYDQGSEAQVDEEQPAQKRRKASSSSADAAGVVEVVLDVGHNPAAMGALARRIAHDYGTTGTCISTTASSDTKSTGNTGSSATGGAASADAYNVHIVYAMSRDKDVRTCLRSVLSVVPHNQIHFVQSKNFRAVSRDELKALFREETGQEMYDIGGTDIRDTLQKVARAAAGLHPSPMDSDADINTGTDGNAAATTTSSSATSSTRNGTGPAGVMIVCGTGYIMPEARAFLGIDEPRDDKDLERVSPSVGAVS